MRRPAVHGTRLAEASTVEVVTADVLNMDAAQLQQEVLRLRTRIHKLIALLRVLLVQRIGKVFASASTWYRLVRNHQWPSVL